jgi:hypothetical protein
LKDDFEDVDISARFQGETAGMIQVYRVADQNALTVAKTVKGYIEKMRPSLPEGVNISFYRDHSRILKSRLEQVRVAVKKSGHRSNPGCLAPGGGDEFASGLLGNPWHTDLLCLRLIAVAAI